MPTTRYWNWQQDDWPNLRFDPEAVRDLEAEFLLRAGILRGALTYSSEDDQDILVVELISDEALYTSEIEGEMLNRDSLQSSIRRNFGLSADRRRVSAAEYGIAEMMVDLYRRHDTPLDHELLWNWHRMLTNGRWDLHNIGCYRTSAEPMQVVSGPIHEPKVHFEAPPSPSVPEEMRRFLEWYGKSAPGGEAPLPILTRAALAHLHFVTIHPFEDGNGRIGRAIAEKAVSEGLLAPTLVSLSRVISRRKKLYYDMLAASNRGLEVTEWVKYFAEMVLRGLRHSQETLNFLLAKTKFYDAFQGRFNARQEKVITRMMREGPEGFTGGLSTENYLAMTGTSRATATRDLAELVTLGALERTGVGRTTRYQLRLPEVGGGQGVMRTL